jgi:tellurite resistance protein TehA-like permease
MDLNQALWLPVPPELHPVLATWLLLAGLVAAGAFTVSTALDARGTRVGWEAALAVLASLALGWGTLFLLLACGVFL